jgi:hypothetical protein
MQLLARPETQRALMSMLLGPAGRKTVPVGNTPVPVGAFANAANVLSGAAVGEYAERVAIESDAMPAYLANFAGEAAVDPSIPEARAARLLELLAENEPEYDESDEGWESDESDESDDFSYSGSAEDIHAYYDAIEQVELAMAGEDW